MSALQSMIKKLAPVTIYNITQNSNIYAELSAYANAIDSLNEELDTALRECFISTSESYGLEIREKVFGNIRDSYSDSERREMLRLRRGFGENDFTKAGLDKFMASLGCPDYRLLESYYTYTISVTLDNALSATDAKWIENQIKLIMPAHLITNVYYGGPRFSDIDSWNITYAQFDNRDYTWDYLENI